jgi:TonB family protein
VLVASNVKTSSGSAALDDAALDTLKRAQPFSPLPADSRQSEGFLIPLIFRIPSLHQNP